MIKMSKLERISDIFNSSEEVVFDDSSKFIMMSDCHRGIGDWSDTFARNQNIYFAALNYYYREGYTYIELGDGDELWQNRNYKDIIHHHSNIFWLMSKFFKEDRLYFLFGNHDMEKRSESFLKDNLYYYYNERGEEYVPLMENIKVHEGLILKYRVTGDKIFLIHGHQVDFLNNDLWRLSRFLVRYLWKPLEFYGVNNPTRAAKNYKKKVGIAKDLTEWVIKENQMLIAGHNHRPMFAEVGDPPYFNDGSCVHPRCITGIEIANGEIYLVKWSVRAKKDSTLFIARDILAGPRKIKDYFNEKEGIGRHKALSLGDGLVKTPFGIHFGYG